MRRAAPKTAVDTGRRRTVFVRDIDREVSEQSLLSFLSGCGTVLESRLCGDPSGSTLRFAFVEFDTEVAATRALSLSGSILGGHASKVLRSKTALVPVNASLLPRSEEDHDRVRRTAYVSNIDLGVDTGEVKRFFEELCGPVSRLLLTRLDGQETLVSFVEFSTAQSADRALTCGGARIRALPLRITPSKTPPQLRDALEAPFPVRRGPGVPRPLFPFSFE